MLSSVSVSSSSISNNGSYSGDRGSNPETEYAIDPASGGIFHSDYKKHEDLKEMLDSNKDNLKLEAMKRVIGMIAKGKDASKLFPAVVKNVVSKNIEVKKLVYEYLERYAEEQQDLALLSISTFQRALKEPNQLIRAGALRVMSSIRVQMIAPIVMLAIRDASADMSPYVRKTAAHAIPKLYSLDSEQKPELILIIQKLLADRTVLVIGSAVMAFTKVCPERVDLIHQVFRKLCTLLVDVDEWGQVIIVNMLTRYARTQFVDPNLHDRAEDPTVSRPFYDSSSESSDRAAAALDPDHRLLLRSVRPLLQSRNAAVVMAVAQLYHHCAPRAESPPAAKALVRLLRSHTEVQGVVLSAIASTSRRSGGVFAPFLKSFFVRTSDPTSIKLLKLDILTNLAADANVSVVLRELQTYISSSDKQFVRATIQAIGRCACSISEVTDSCLNGLISLLSNRDEAVVAESVVVIKRLLQTRAADPVDIITHMAKLFDSITVAQARAAILWLLGEHCQSVPKIAPDVLRKVAKTFADEHDIVKLQVLNLAVKLYITNPEQTLILCQYVFNLARYDQNYDIRDRVRLLKHFTQSSDRLLVSQASNIFLAPKPAPVTAQTQFRDREELQLGSLSHYINATATGYEPLPPFPEVPPPGDVRNVEPFDNSMDSCVSSDKNNKSALWESEQSSAASSGSESSSEESESSSGSSSSEEDEDETTESEASSPEKNSKKSKEKKKSSSEEDEEEETESGSSSEESGSSSSSEESSGESTPAKDSNPPKKPAVKDESKREPVKNDKQKKNLDLLLDLDDIDTIVPVMTPSMGGFLTPITSNTTVNNQIQVMPPQFLPTKQIELLNRITGKGLGITYRYTRNPHLFNPSMISLNLVFTNSTREDITNIKVGEKNLPLGMMIYDFYEIPQLQPNRSLSGVLGIDFNDSTHPAVIEILSSVGSSTVSIKPAIGELLRPVTMPENVFEREQAKLRGMNEVTGSISATGLNGISQKILEVANLSPCPSQEGILRFAGQTWTSSSLVLVTVDPQESVINITVNCEKMVIGSMLLNELKCAVK